MNPIFLPSLQHMASVTISTHIYCNSEIQRMRHMIKHLPLDHPDNLTQFTRWKRMKETTMEILPAELPKLLKTRLADYISCIQQQLNDWLIDHPYVDLFIDGYNHFSSISWKSEGTIDRLQTAKNMLRNPHFYSVGRFLMACTYFLEDDILDLWEKLKGNNFRAERNLVIRFWMKWLNRPDEMHWSQMFSEHFINPEIKPCDRSVRVTRIFDFLPQESRSGYITKFHQLGHNDDIRLCLNQLDGQQRIQLMKSNPLGVLTAYLRWPFQILFMKMADQLWAYMTVDDYYYILMLFLFNYIFTCLQHFDYLRLFREFWHNSPALFREYVRKHVQFKVVEDILNYDKDSCNLSLEDADEYYHRFF